MLQRIFQFNSEIHFPLLHVNKHNVIFLGPKGHGKHSFYSAISTDQALSLKNVLYGKMIA